MSTTAFRVPIGSIYVRPLPSRARSEPRPALVLVPPPDPGFRPPPPRTMKRPRVGDRVVELARRRETIDAESVVAFLDITRGYAHALLSRLAFAGQLKRMEMGRYAAASEVNAVPTQR